MGERSSTFLIVAARTAPLFAAIPFVGIATGALYPLVALDLHARGFQELFIGVVTSAYYAGSAVGAITFGAVVRSRGFRVAFGVAACITALSTWALPISDDALVWLLLRFLAGYGVGALYLVIESWVNALATATTRGKLLATAETLRLVAVASGPMFLVVGATHASVPILAAAYVLSVVPVLWSTEPSSDARMSRPRGILTMFRCFPLALVNVTVSGLLSASFYGLGAIYAQQIGATRVQISIFVSVVLLAPAISQIPLGAAADRFGRMRVAASGGILAALVALVLVHLGTPQFLLACALAAMIAGLAQPLYTLGLGRLVDALDDEYIVPATTACILAYMIGGVVGPAVGGAAMSALGPAGLYVWTCGCIAAAAIAALLDAFRHNQCCPAS